MNRSKINIAITPGDMKGVGPELLAQAMSDSEIKESVQFFWCHDLSSLKESALRAKIELKIVGDYCAKLNNGAPIYFFTNQERKNITAQALKKSVELAKNKLVQAIVTGPTDKLSLQDLGDNYCGQTEFFAEHLGVDRPFMSFLGGPFMLSLLTTHMPLYKVPASLSEHKIVEHIFSVAEKAQGITKKDLDQLKIVILGLNPHAGENGFLGKEEIDIFLPAIKKAQKKRINILGPVSADGFFSYLSLNQENYPDVVISPYHDQGLIAYKILAQRKAVNVTMGLSIPRVSPAHGTATEIAGKNKACPLSTKMAIRVAMQLAS